MNVAIVPVMEYRDVYDDNPIALSEIIGSVNRDLILKSINYFLYYRSQQIGPRADIEFMLNDYFGGEHKNEISRIVRPALIKAKLYHREFYDIVLLSIESGLQIIQYCINNPLTDDHPEKPGDKAAIIRAFLFQNQQNTTKEEQIFPSLSSFNHPDKEVISFMVQSYKYSRFYSYNSNYVFASEIIKVYKLLQLLESDSKYQYLYQKFLEHYQITHWKDYVYDFAALSMNLKKELGDVAFNLNILSDSQIYDSLKYFMDSMTVNNEVDERDERDFASLRDRPMLSLEKDKYTIIFKLFLLEKIFIGLYFLLNEINAKLPEDQRVTKKSKDFKGHWGDKFIEKSILYPILTAHVRKGNISLNGDEILKYASGGIDFYIRKGKRIILFESKDVLMKAEVIRSVNFTSMEHELKEKYLEDTKDGSKKAVKQLIENIRRVLLKENKKFDSDYSASNCLIYPVIVTNSSLVDVPGLNYLVNIWFEQELVKLKTSGISVDNVRPATMVALETLIVAEEHFSKGKVELTDAIDKYCNYTMRRKIKSGVNYSGETLYKMATPFTTFFGELCKRIKLDNVVPEELLRITNELMLYNRKIKE